MEVLDPAAADAEEARRLEAEEADARAAASFTMADDGHGRCHGRFTIPSLHGSILRKHLMALAAPKRNPDVPSSTPSRHRLGQAFCEYLETRPDDTVPHSGGLAATVVVTMTHESLLGDLQAAGLCDGTRISAGEARGWPAARGSSRSSSAEPPNPSTSAGNAASTPEPNGSRWGSATAAARPSGVIAPPR